MKLGKSSKAKPVSAAWQLQTAKARFSELFRRARTEGPQLVTRQGKEAVVVVPQEHFQELVTRAAQPVGLAQFFSKSPLARVRLRLERDRDPGRTLQL